MKWINPSVSMPKAYKNVIVTTGHTVTIGLYNPPEKKWHESRADDWRGISVIGWMELPDPEVKK